MPSVGEAIAEVLAAALANVITAWFIRKLFTSAAVRTSPLVKTFLGIGFP
jgi:hypothetical protein